MTNRTASAISEDPDSGYSLPLQNKYAVLSLEEAFDLNSFFRIPDSDQNSISCANYSEQLQRLYEREQQGFSSHQERAVHGMKIAKCLSRKAMFEKIAQRSKPVGEPARIASTDVQVTQSTEKANKSAEISLQHIISPNYTCLMDNNSVFHTYIHIGWASGTMMVNHAASQLG